VIDEVSRLRSRFTRFDEHGCLDCKLAFWPRVGPMTSPPWQPLPQIRFLGTVLVLIEPL